MSDYIPRLPRNVADGTEVSDRYGNIWQYNAAENTWISKGVIGQQPIVSEDQDGLATPAIYSKLGILRQYSTDGTLFNSLKIVPGIDAYWYYFRSADKLKIGRAHV